MRLAKPTVDDEIRMGLRYFRLSLFDALPKIYAEVVESFRDVYGIDLDANQLPNLVNFGSWIGGDRDGNPLVKPDCIRDALAMARALILREYLNDVESLSDRLSSSRRQTDVSEELLSRLKLYERTTTGVHLAWGAHNTTETYRRFLSYMFHKLQQSRLAVDAPAAYGNAAEFEADLLLVQSSLESNRGERLARTYVSSLLRKVRTFGFHLHTLDIRQHAQVHARVVEELGDTPERSTNSAESRDLLDTFRAIAKLKRTYPAQSIRHYIISGAESENDVLNVIRLAKAAESVARSPRWIKRRPRLNAGAAVRIHRFTARFRRRHAPPMERSRNISRCSIPGDAGRKSCSATPTPTKTEACSPAPGNFIKRIANCIKRRRNTE